ncbi:MAG: hypothetical protein ACKKL6_01350 [Candidatus Komeilibacteria bacterium]
MSTKVVDNSIIKKWCYNIYMKYLLKNIELWEYDGQNLPKLFKNTLLVDQYISKKYSVTEFDNLLNNIRDQLNKDDWQVLATMNPLYPDKGFTVISIDISKDPQDPNKHQTLSKSAKINTLVERHKKLSSELFEKNSSNIQYSIINNILYSQDKKLKSIENKIHELVTDKNYNPYLESNNISYNDLYAMQWATKNNKLLNTIISVLNGKNEHNKNIVLLMLIPIMQKLETKMQSKILNILTTKTLYLPCSAVRNKALSLMSLLPNHLLLLNEDLIKLINTIAESDQLNSSYPAKKILQKKSAVH